MKDFKVLERFTTDEGYTAVVMGRNPYIPHINGYLVIPKDHPLHGVDYDDDRFDDLNVHGGITFAGTHMNILGGKEWLIGFDTLHLGDDFNWDMALEHLVETKEEKDKIRRIKNRIGSLGLGDSATVWTAEMVKNELKNLSKQVKALDK